MLHRLICAILAALLPLLVALPVFAQDDSSSSPVICGELPEADCALIEESDLAMRDLSSYSIAASADFSMSGIPDMPADPLAVNVQFDGSFAMDDAAKAVAQQKRSLMLGGSVEDAEAMGRNMPDMLRDLFGGMDFDVTFHYTVPPELADAISQDSDVPMPETFAIEMRLIDGTMYINVADLRALDPSMAEEITSDWIGIDYVGLLEMQMQQDSMEGDPAAASAAASLAMSQFMEEMKQYVSVERLDDTDLGDQEGAVFAYTVDIIGFLTSDSFRTAVENTLTAAGEDMSASDVEEGITMLNFVAPMVFRDLEIGAQTEIGLDDKMLYSQAFDFSWDLASVMKFAAMSDPSVAESLGDAQPAISFSFSGEYADFNDEMLFEVPEDVQMIPLEQLAPPDTSAVF